MPRAPSVTRSDAQNHEDEPRVLNELREARGRELEVVPAPIGAYVEELHGEDLELGPHVGMQKEPDQHAKEHAHGRPPSELSRRHGTGDDMGDERQEE